MRRSVLTILALLMAMPFATAVAADGNTGTKNRDQEIVAQPIEGALPVVAKNQLRPRSIRVADWDEGDNSPLNPDYDDGGAGGGYTEGACNCGRICYPPNTTCELSTSNVGCRAGGYAPKPCKSCSSSCI